MLPSVRARLRQSFQRHCAELPVPNYKRYIDSIEQILSLPGLDQVVYMVCDNLNYQILYASDSTNLFGFATNGEASPGPADVARYHSLLTTDHADYSFLADSWHLSLHDRLPQEQRVNSQAVHCGMKFSRPDGRTGRLLAVSHFVEPDANNLPRIVLVIMQDVAHLIKGDHYWMRATFGEQNERVFCYLSHQREALEIDILSVREKEVLRCLHKGKDSKEIAQQLGITVETVQKHRRNMLARTGARDTTALLQLAIWCSLL
ncbi:hypothetical protein J2I47_23345 [Fibrella sp. HMF5335]|uniref:HTH luxR-type domain-containing protein n=1 Tax=Fibrella rubiginis TaxID=2817060 RepID=A0A939K899_9BACT|nr:helix-turn-helix transcriptional regulator [Fibrella rubiginis]MBO0939505.1 hypothetical protein [Fibrella rubiginis]